MKQEHIIRVKPQSLADIRSCDILSNFIKDRVLNSNRNFMCCVTGATGTGKSYSCIGLARLIDPYFGIENVVFSQTEFMDLINSGKLKRGSVIVFDEVSVSQNARDWYSQTNKLLNNVLCTFRHLNLVVFFTVPFSEFVDKQARMLFHATFEALSIDFNRNLNFVKPAFMQYNQGNQKLYTKFLQIQVANGSRYKLSKVAVPRAELPLLNLYEDKREAFTTTLNKVTIADKPAPKEKPITKKAQIIEMVKQGMTVKDIAIKLDTDQAYVRDIKRVVVIHSA